MEYVLNNKTDIKDYANQNLHILTELSVNSELNLLQKADVKKNYQILYFNIRKLEKEQVYWENELMMLVHCQFMIKLNWFAIVWNPFIIDVTLFNDLFF